MKNFLLILISSILTFNISAYDFIMEQKLWTANTEEGNKINICDNGLHFYGDVRKSNGLEINEEGIFSNGASWNSKSFWILSGCNVDANIFNGTRKIAGKDYTDISEAIAFNAFVSGTCHVIVKRVDPSKSNQLSLLNQFRGFKGKWTYDIINSNIERDFQEIKINIQSNSSVWIFSDSPLHILAVNFVPDHNNTINYNNSSLIL